MHLRHVCTVVYSLVTKEIFLTEALFVTLMSSFTWVAIGNQSSCRTTEFMLICELDSNGGYGPVVNAGFMLISELDISGEYGPVVNAGFTLISELDLSGEYGPVVNAGFMLHGEQESNVSYAAFL